MVHARHPLGVGIVHAHNPAIGGKPEIALDRVGSLLPGKPEGGERVLRGVVRRTAVGRDQLAGGLPWEQEREGRRHEKPCHGGAPQS